jgi:hypothetical protein
MAIYIYTHTYMYNMYRLVRILEGFGRDTCRAGMFCMGDSSHVRLDVVVAKRLNGIHVHVLDAHA